MYWGKYKLFFITILLTCAFVCLFSTFIKKLIKLSCCKNLKGAIRPSFIVISLLWAFRKLIRNMEYKIGIGMTTEGMTF